MLFEEDPLYLHYMTDRQERFDRKIKLENTVETKTPTSWMPLRYAKTYQK